MQELRRRLGPFIALLDTRYLPLLFAASYQAYTVYRWLWQGSEQTTADHLFAILGGLAFETVYIGCIAWTDAGQRNGWMTFTLAAALGFSVAVAIHMYAATQGYWAILHAGFPVVAFGYAQAMHGKHAHAPQASPSVDVDTLPSLALPTVDTLPTVDVDTMPAIAAPVKRQRAASSVDSEILAMRASGMSYAAIGARLGMSRQSAQQRHDKAVSKVQEVAA